MSRFYITKVACVAVASFPRFQEARENEGRGGRPHAPQALGKEMTATQAINKETCWPV